MASFIWPVMKGSEIIITWPVRISACFSPTRAFMVSARAEVFCVNSATAAERRDFSASVPAKTAPEKSRSGSTSKTAFPMPIPSDAAIPWYIAIPPLIG